MSPRGTDHIFILSTRRRLHLPLVVGQELGVWPLRDRCRVRGIYPRTTSLLIVRITPTLSPALRVAEDRCGVSSKQPSFSLIVADEGRNVLTTSPQSPTPPSTAPSQRVGPPASGVADFRGVTGGVYKARERIHPGVADPGLLATPASWSRVADSNPN